MLNEYILWKSELRRAIDCLRAIEFQNSACWEGAKAGGASFHYAMTHLYGDCKFPDFLALEAWRQAGLSPQDGKALQDFKNHLDAYDEPETDAAILADPLWHAILKEAARIVSLLD
jgi:hypothetical protein